MNDLDKKSLENAKKLFSSNDIDNIEKSESLVVVLLIWILFSLITTIPYLFYDISFVDSVFEAVSGITTTGSTIFEDFSLYQ